MDFKKVTFRPNPREQAYLTDLCRLYGAASVSELFHCFLEDCIYLGFPRIKNGVVLGGVAHSTYGNQNDARSARLVAKEVSGNTSYTLPNAMKRQQGHMAQLLDINKISRSQDAYFQMPLPPFWVAPRQEPFDPIKTVIEYTDNLVQFKKLVNEL
jgi:hypothetical protein